jgi:low affinity Fe/Cu permease
MPEKSKMRKRLLYDLSPIPGVPVNDGAKGKLEPEIRVVYDNKVLLDLQKVDKKFTLGTENGADCIVDEAFLSDNMFDFASVSGQNFSVSLKNGFKGTLYKGTEKTDLEKYIAEGHTSVDIDDTTLLVADFGKISVCALKSPAEKYKGGALQFDFAFAIILLLIFIIGGFVFNMIVETPPIEVDIFELDNRFAKLIVETKEEEIKVEEIEEEKKVKLEKPKEGLVEATSQRKSLGEEGRVGDKKSRVANAQGSARRGLDAKVAQSSGIMGALSSGAASFDRVFGGGGLGAGMEKTLGSVTGLAGVDQFGSGGLGTRGFGTGGGGNALGIGGLGTRGRGGGGAGGKYGMAAGQIGRKGRSDISAGGGQAVIMGALDRSVIDAYIRRNLAKIRWCYEKELNKDPKLFGRIVINFIISATGAVSSSKVQRTTMGNATVESCVADQIKKIRFPAPKGGGIVIVNYPFVFKNSES